MKEHDPYFKQLQQVMPNIVAKRLLTLAGAKVANNYSRNLKTLSKVLQKKYPSGLIPTERLGSERYLTDLISGKKSKVAILDPQTILKDNNIYVAEGQDATQVLADHVNQKDRAKVFDMINEAQNYELIQATMEDYPYSPIVNEEVEYTNEKGEVIGHLGEAEIIIKEPEDVSGYLLAKVNAQNQIKEYSYEKKDKLEPFAIDGEPYFNYYSNYVESLEDIYAFLDQIYKIEKKPFKLHFSFGCIYEEPTVGGKWAYSFVNANPFLVKRSIPAVVNGPETLELYKKYILNTIEQAKEITYISTKHRWISIVNVMFSVYRMMSVQGKLDFLPEELLKNRSLCHYNEDNNLCFWAAYSAYLRTVENRIDKNGLRTTLLTQDAKKVLKDWCDYRKVKYDWANYRGFDMIDIKDFAKWAGVNISVYEYDQESKSFAVFQTHTIDFPRFETPFNILLLSEFYKETNKTQHHIMYIKDPELLCGILICPKCNQYCYNKKAKSANKYRFEAHVAKCNGKMEKKVRLDSIAHPYWGQSHFSPKVTPFFAFLPRFYDKYPLATESSRDIWGLVYPIGAPISMHIKQSIRW